MKKIIRLVSLIVVVSISIVALILYFIFNGSFMNNFRITKVSNLGTEFYLYFEEVKSAQNYDVIVYNSNNEIEYRGNVKNNFLTINFDRLKYNEVYEIMVIAYDKNGVKKNVKEPYSFLWDDLSFSENNIPLMDNENDYIVEFLGNFKKKKYTLNFKDDKNKVLYTELINSEQIIIKNDFFKDVSGKFILEILEDKKIISKLEVYNLMSPITDIKILNPSNGDMKDYADIPLSFEGGDNASNYIFELYRNNKLIRTKEIKNKKIILSNNLFDKTSSYKVKIIAKYYEYEDYKKIGEVDFTINPKETLNPVYTNFNTSMIKSGSKITLKSPDKDAIIYYTVDGSDPLEFGIKYEDEIIVDKDMTIKAVAKADMKNDSIVSTFDFKVGYKNKYKVYLSPSNQTSNLGVSEVGYTNEEKEMNDLTNYIEDKLKNYNVEVYRNGYGGINRWTQDSVYLGVDLHLAIHSNASEDGNAYGIETWINEPNSKTYSLAQNIQNGLMNIYYNKEDEIANRGVKYAYGSLGEVTYVPFGILVEVAHHDYKEDADWIMKNKKLIGDTIADSILEYFQIK